jgi:hypothetical protein
MGPVASTDVADVASLVRCWHDGVTALDDDALIAFAGEFARLRAGVDALWVELAGVIDTRGVSSRMGARTAADWLAALSGERRGAVRRDVELAAALDEAPVVAAAMREGLSKAKAIELVEAAALPVETQHALISAAASQPVEQVAAAVRRARLQHGATEPPVEVTATLTRHGDRVCLEATMDLAGGEAVEIALDSIAHQLSTDIPYRCRRGHALVAMARYWLDHSPDAPTTRVGRPHLMVNIDLATLEARTGGTATLGSGAVITGAQARQLACDANVTRLITGPRSEPLDVGTTTRTIPAGIAKAVTARDRHCRFEGCHAPPWNCDIHHRQPWAQGGPTTVDNLGLVCWYHHHELHRRGPNLLEVTDDGRWRLPRAGAT